MSEGGGNGDLPVLWQLRFSHYNEKARWALDYKGVEHRRHSLAPGTHAIRARRMWGTATTPVLEIDGEMIGDSTEIIAELERRWPEPPLYPAAEVDRRRALELEAHFDSELGPYIRGAIFETMIPHRDVLVPVSTQGLGRRTRIAHNLLYPVTRRILRRALVEDPGGAELCFEKTALALDYLEAELGGAGHLVGNGFTVADLTAAALFAPLVAPPQFPYDMPDPWPPEWERFRESVRDRPAYHWVQQTYQRHRGTTAEVRA